jgi:hypothetical protein
MRTTPRRTYPRTRKLKGFEDSVVPGQLLGHSERAPTLSFRLAVPVQVFILVEARTAAVKIAPRESCSQWSEEPLQARTIGRGDALDTAEISFRYGVADDGRTTFFGARVGANQSRPTAALVSLLELGCARQNYK